jgi:hypothetical protein
MEKKTQMKKSFYCKTCKKTIKVDFNKCKGLLNWKCKCNTICLPIWYSGIIIKGCENIKN